MEQEPFTEKRIFPRFTVNIPLTILDLVSRKSFFAETHDISSQGLCVVTDDRLPSGSNVDMCIQMVDNNEKLCVKGKVVWSCIIESGKYKLGIELEAPKLKPIPLVLRTIMSQRKYLLSPPSLTKT